LSTDVDTGHVREYLAARQQVQSAGVSPCGPELKRKTEH